MANKKIYDIFTDFLKKYEHIFIDNDTKWLSTMDICKKYIYHNNKKPDRPSKTLDIRTIGQWLSNLLTNYKTKKQIMANKKIYDIFTVFLKKYEHIFVKNKSNNNKT